MKKFVTLALSFLLLFSAVACSNRGNTTTKNENQATDKAGYDTTNNNAYNDTYRGLYDENIGTLGQYSMYTDVNSVNNAYKNKEYPGNEKYLSEVKAAYKDSKEKIQRFVNGLKNDAKTDDAELKKMNEELIAEGEKAIRDIDAKMARLDKISKEDYNKTQDEFIRLVDNTVREGETVNNKFNDMIKNMNDRLGMNTNNTNNTNNMNNTNNKK